MFRLRATAVRILRSTPPVSFDALLYFGMGNGKHAIYKAREGVVFRRHVHSVSRLRAVSFL